MGKYAVFIGRFQPFHNAHLESVRFGLTQAEKLIIVIGSAGGARTVKNPWSAAERIGLITASLTEAERERVLFVCAKDYLYSNNYWITALQSEVHEVAPDINDGATVLIGHKKDSSSFYLKLFPQWTFVETGIRFDAKFDATRVREALFRQDVLTLKTSVPKPVHNMLLNYMGTEEYKRLHEEFHMVEDSKARWLGSPFKPTFNTVDAVVICSGHALVVRRRAAPGRGLLALPGGYLEQDEDLDDGCIRELKEETGIRIPEKELLKKISGRKSFGHPGRSLLGRVITHACCIDLGDGELPPVKGMDDADKAFWLSLREVNMREDQFFDDHFHIIQYFASRF